VGWRQQLAQEVEDRACGGRDRLAAWEGKGKNEERKKKEKKIFFCSEVQKKLRKIGFDLNKFWKNP
jgi:hypothetical protein